MLLVAGCSSWSDGWEIPGRRHLTDVRSSGGRGGIHLKIPVEEGEGAVLVTAAPDDDHMVVFSEVADPDGTVVYDVDEEWASGRTKTGGRYAQDVGSLNWPVLADDLPLSAGTWSFRLGVLDSELHYRSGVRTEVDVVTKSDEDLSSGTLRVRVVFAGATADDSEIARAASIAEDRVASLYEGIGLEVEITEESAEGVGDLTAPGQTSGEAYAALAADAEPGVVTVVIVSEFEGSEGIYGVAGGIPGPLVPTARSVVVLSVVANAGIDLEFDELEERLFGETMAHELLHYLGLFHPVEISWSEWDAVGDTSECHTAGDCEERLGDNLMFPYPVCSEDDCVPQVEITEGQGGIAHRYVGVD